MSDFHDLISRLRKAADQDGPTPPRRLEHGVLMLAAAKALEAQAAPVVASHQEQALTPGEQLVWAASFAHHVDGGTPAAISARIATQRVHDLRELTTAALDVLGRVGSRAGAAANLASSVVMAAVEQMRGGR